MNDVNELKSLRLSVIKSRARSLAILAGITVVLATTAQRAFGEEIGIKLRTNLTRAIQRRDEVEVRLLLLLGVSPSGRTAGVAPPLMAAIEVGDTELARRLMALGADLKPQLKSGDAPLCLARRLHLAELATLLAEQGGACDRPH